MSIETHLKPIPQPTHESKPYWDALMEGKLLLQRCGRCGKVRHYPRPLCNGCYSFDVTWIAASGRGRVHSWTVAHHAFHPGFKADLPYVLVTVDLEEGVRLQAPLRGVRETDIKVGLPVRITFEKATADLATPAFVADA